MNDKTYLGTIAQIKQWRIKHNVSQKALATAAGVSRNTYASWERRNTVIGGAECIKMNKAIFAWGEIDCITKEQIQRNETPAKPEHTTKKKSIMFRIGYFFGRIIRFIIISIWFVLKKLYIIK